MRTRTLLKLGKAGKIYVRVLDRRQQPYFGFRTLTEDYRILPNIRQE